MSSFKTKYKGGTIRVSRCGYTGEDGFEISVGGKAVEEFVKELEKVKDEKG